MKHVFAPLSSLVGSPHNANVMSKDKYAGLIESIRRVGFVVPILIKELDLGRNLIVDGHHRSRAAGELGMTDVPAVMLEGNEDPRVVALAVNRLRGETDLAVASIIMLELVEAGLQPIDLSITGFSEREINDLLAATQSPDDVELDDLSGSSLPEEVGTPALKPYLLELTFRRKEDLLAARRALKKAAGRGGDHSDGLLRLIRGEA